MITRARFLAVFILLAATALFINLHSDISVPMNKPFDEFPTDHLQWKMTSQTTFSESVLNVLRPTDYMLRRYAATDELPVDLYIGYHSGGQKSGELHSPRNCMPGSGWYMVSQQKMDVKVDNNNMKIVKTVYQKGSDKELFLYWFQVKGKIVSDEYSLKIYEVLNSILFNRKDAAFIRISVPVGDDENRALLSGMKFLKDFYPVIQEFLPK
ncbi:MAG: EpsI family protein [Nitrospirae bacterium]|nr:EpsI family protein [Nitrospirota bacterium]